MDAEFAADANVAPVAGLQARVGVDRTGYRGGWWSEQEPAPVWTADAEDSAWLQHAVQFAQLLNLVGQLLHQGVAEDSVEGAVLEGQREAVRGLKGDVADVREGRVGSREFDLGRLRVNADDATRSDALGNPQ